MEFNVTTQKNWHTVIDVTVPPDNIKPELDKNYKEYQSNVKVGGFRQGKVPMGLVKKMFGDEIEKETFRPYISEAWQEIFKDEKAYENMINEPYITNMKFDEKAGLTFNIEYDVRPDFAVTGYEKLSIDKEVYKVDQEDIDKMIEDLRQRNAMIHTVEGEAQEGHFLLADLQELDASGVPVVGHKYENQQIWLSAENTELLSQLAGVKAGEEKRIVLTLKEDKDGETVETQQNFNVIVKEIKERRLPELDDDFAKDLGPYEDLKSLEKAIQDSLQNQADMETKMRFETALKNEMFTLTEIEAPPSMVERYMNALISDYKKRPEGKKVTDEQLREYYGPLAVRNIKWMLIHEKLVEQEKINVADKEVDAKIKELEDSASEHDKQHASEYKESEEARESLRDRLLEDKVVDFLAKKLNVNTTTKKWRDLQAEQAAAVETAGAEE